MSDKFVIGVVGNPNSGKTTLFNAMTGAKQRVGNWPGVTVERKVGAYQHDDVSYEVIDLPGTYSLDVTNEDISLDEKIARDFVHANEADVIVNIVDASNLERNLYLTAQLIEMRKPMIVALNMMDVAEAMGVKVDVAGMADKLGCPVVPVVAVNQNGVPELKDAVAEAVKTKPVSAAKIAYDDSLETAITGLMAQVQSTADAAGANSRWLAARLLEGDGLARRLAGPSVVSDEALAESQSNLSEDVDILLADGRYGFANSAAQAHAKKAAKVSRNISDKIDRVVLNRALGIPIFLGMMYLMFMFTINIGGSFIDFFDIFSGAIFVDGFGALLASLGMPDIGVLLLATGIGGGIQVVATFIPVIAFLYLFLSVLEDSGYMARAAFVMDRAMRAVGLPGKSFVPLIVGFGCNIPAIMATRTLEQHRDRIMTIVMAPFMSCGARLPVYALFAAAFFPIGGQNIVFGLYLIGIAVAVLTGLVMKNTILQGETSPFVMELPPYHMPTFKGVMIRVWDRTMSFVVRAGKIIVPMVLVLNVMNSIGTDGSFGNEDTENSVLSEVGKSIAPAFSPMGLDEENWPAAVGLFTGILAKEAVVGTLDSMYTAMAEAEAAAAGIVEEEEPFSLMAGITEAFETIPANLGDAMGTWADPMGISVGDVSTIDAASEEQEVATGTFGAMAAKFDGAAGAFAYLLFILLYFPCTAALAAVYRETNLAWTAFVGAWTTGIAYVIATISYQSAIFTRDPVSSGLWIAIMVGISVVTFVGLRIWGSREPQPGMPAAEGKA